MSLILYLGPMFAGKSTAVLGVIRRNAIIKRPTLCITSALDTRYSEEGAITSHDQSSCPAIATKQLLPLLQNPEYEKAHCIIVEEAQFFPDLMDFVLTAVEFDKKTVICAGLDGDSERRPFGQLLDLIPYANSVQKFAALCRRCADGTEAIFTFRKPGAPATQVSVGGQDQYEPLCRAHYIEGKHALARQAAFERELPNVEKGAGAIAQLERCIAQFGPRVGTELYNEILDAQGQLPSIR